MLLAIAVAVGVNNTLMDMVLYPNEDCSGDMTTYVATTLSDNIAPGARPLWSYSLAH